MLNERFHFLNSTIGRKIKFSFIFIITINVIYGAYTFITLSNSIDVLDKVTNDINRSIESINEFRNAVENSRSYATNWVYVSKYKKDKEKLEDIHSNIYPLLKKDLISHIASPTEIGSSDQIITSAIESFDSILVSQKTIVEILHSENEYEDIINVLICEELLERNVIPKSGVLVEKVDQVLAEKKQELSSLTMDMENSFSSLNSMILILSVIGTIIAIIIANWLSSNITNPLNALQEKISLMSQGVIAEPISIKSNDEIGKMSQGINSLIESFKLLSTFASEIGKGNLETDFNTRSAQDVLGNSLILMRNNLKRVIDDTKEVVRIAGEEGMLSAKIESSDKRGAWRELSIAINDLLVSISSPMLMLNNITLAMSKGDLTKKYDRPEKGEIFNLTDSLNKAIIGLNELLNKISENSDIVDQSSDEMLTVSEEMNSNTKEIASAISEISTGAQNQVTQVDEVSSLIEGILNSSNDMKERAAAINTAAKIGFESGEKGRIMIENLLNSMNQIASFSQKTNTSMDVLTNRSKEITRVIDVISEIASQTNLLALNAAIEAAQAGDAGRGFAVVAEEIRKLAEDSKKSASQIEQLILDVQKDTEEASNTIEAMNKTVANGKKTSEDAAMVFNEIEQSSTRTLSHSEDILKATTTQKENVTKVVSISESVVVIAEETAAGTEETASAVTQLSSGMKSFFEKAQQMGGVASSLKEEIEKLNLIKK
ncbi:MAG: methyl-accepting chemotaxis protein [Ekhidna sp.]